MDQNSSEYDLNKLLGEDRSIDNGEISSIEDYNDEVHIHLDTVHASTLKPQEMRQLYLEWKMRSIARDKYKKNQSRLKAIKQLDKDDTFRRLKREYLEKVIFEITSSINDMQQCRLDPARSYDTILLPLAERFVDIVGAEVLASVSFNLVLQSLDLSRKLGYEQKLNTRIGEEVDYESFVTSAMNYDPQIIRSLGGFNLENSAGGTMRTIKANIRKINGKWDQMFEWVWLSEEDRARVGSWLRDCVYYGTELFTTGVIYEGTKTKYKVSLSEYGKTKVEFLQDAVLRDQYENWLMICPPRDWQLNPKGFIYGGGYFLPGPRSQSISVHNNKGSIPSPQALDAINNLQGQAIRINRFIFDLQKKLKRKHIEIGKFRSFNLGHYHNINPLIIDEEIDSISWDDAREDPELLKKKKELYAQRKRYEEQCNLSQQKAMPIERLIDIVNIRINPRDDLAEHGDEICKLLGVQSVDEIPDYVLEPYATVDEDRLYTPWYYDSRLRMYPLVDTLNPQGTDHTKALIMFSDGVPTSEHSRRELLVSIATCYGNKLDKMSFDDRVKGALKMECLFELLATDPESKSAMKLWTKADEPFQFLALVHEYYHCFLVDEEYRQLTHHVPGGRDATCSGIQIAGSLLRDKKTMHLVNVTPSDVPQDAYRAVAEEALKLINNKDWLDQKIEQRETSREKKALRIIAKEQQLVKEGKMEEVKYSYVPRYKCEIDKKLVDRSVAKMIVMLTPYGGSYQTMFKHVVEKMEAKGSTMDRADYTILTHALIEGMAMALPGFSAVNQWFKNLAKTVINTYDDFTGQRTNRVIWITPNGSTIIQQYFQDTTHYVKTYTQGKSSMKKHTLTVYKPSKELREGKMQTALAANTIHSLDACIIQGAIHDYQSSAFAAVHDCIYAPSGALSALTDRIRRSFLYTVSGDFLMSMLDENELGENQELVGILSSMTHNENEELLHTVLDSKYLFS